jgi:hypothetical protein
MESATFDGITRNFGGMTRRSALRGLFAGAVATVAGSAVLQAEDAGAKRRRKKGKKNQNQTLRIGARCQRSSQCPSSYICEVAVNAGNSDKTCSGGTGAACGAPNADGDDTAPFCAVGYSCALTSQSNQTGTGVCQAAP